jgi:ATP-dependent helicase IRC3
MLQTSLFKTSEPEKKVTQARTGDPDGLRDYQRHRVDQCITLLAAFRSVLLNMHTGAGKTVTAGTIAKHWPGRVLWLAHRDFLCHQARVELSRLSGEYVDLEKANWRAGDSRLVVASVQSLKGTRLTGKPSDSYSLIITDEAHHGTSSSYRAIYDHFSGAKLLHITATPKRTDKIGMHNITEAHCDPFDIETGLVWGSFVPIVTVSEFIDNIDLSKIKTQAGDLALGDLETQIAENAGSIAKLCVKHMGDYQTIVYTPGVASAHAVAATLREMGYTAIAVDADTEDNVRIQVLKDFRERKLQYVVNCAIYTEGLDVPGARGIVIARPTKSESLYIQMAGRGGRPEGWIGSLATSIERITAIASSAKPNFKLLDITGHAGKHSLVCGTDLLGGRRIKEAVNIVKEQIKNGRNDGATIDEMLDEAEKSLKQQEEESRRRIAEVAAQAEVISRTSTFDPLKKLGFDERHHGEEPSNPASPASPDDVTWLKKNRLPHKNVTRGMASKLRRQASEWAKANLASWRQRHLLSQFKQPVDIPFSVASQAIDHIIKSNFNPNFLTLSRIIDAGIPGK